VGVKIASNGRRSAASGRRVPALRSDDDMASLRLIEPREVPVLTFAPFRLDLDSERLWKHDHEVRLRRKPFAILRFLVQNPRRLVTHAEVVEAVWGKIAMSESLLRTHVHDLRGVLGEGIVETVVGRGYRFVAEIQHVYTDDRGLPELPAQDGASRRVVGRESELDALRATLRSVRDRKRAVVFVTGEAGIGKTTLVDLLVERESEQGRLLVGRGACVEQYGSGQAYLPLLDAIGTLCRSPGSRVVDTFAEHAPTWLAQMPALVRPDRLAELQRRASGATQGRTLRELAEALDALSADAPVIIAFDDLQWTDPSTAEFIAFLGSRREPARLLLVGTYRAAEVLRGHPLTKVTAELIARRQASAIALDSLGIEAVEAYLSRRFPHHGFPPKLVATIHQSTGGNPLFITTLVDELEGKGLLRAREGRWELSTSVEDVAARRPDSIRRLIDTQIDRLPALEQRILETAAVAGATFAAGVVAHALDAEVDSVDSACESLANDRRFLQYVGTETWPDGTIQSRYAFVHSLFQHASLTRSTSASIRAHHRKIAERLESGNVRREEEVAAELAVHFDHAHAPAKAAHYYVTAGDRAGHRYGVLEAITHYERACTLLAGLPESRERNLLEMHAKRTLGWRLFQRDGSTDAAVPLVERSRELATALEDGATLAEILLRLGSLFMVRGDMVKAGQHVRAATPLLHLLPDAPRAFGRELAAITVLIQGDPSEALRLLEASGILRATAEQVVADRKGTHLTSMAYGSFALWLAGRPDDAVGLARRGYRVAELLDDPWERAALLSDWAMLHAWRREPARAKELAAQSLALAEERTFGMWRHRAGLVLRWAEAELAPVTTRERADELLNTPWESVALGRTQPSLLYATLCARLGRTDDALRLISRTVVSLAEGEERWLEAEFHRLRGAILAPVDAHEAERSIVTAIEVAQKQASVSLELRATLALCPLVSGAKKARACRELARLLGLVVGGEESPDVVEARRLTDAHANANANANV
jgi:DNA-binding winged helix-turn-helix (wHTH) protein